MPRSLLRCAAMLFTAVFASADAFAAVVAGDLIVSDEYNERILRVRPSDGSIEVVSPKPGQPNLLESPADLVVTDAGRLFVADASAEKIFEIDLATGQQSPLQSYGLVGFDLGGPIFGFYDLAFYNLMDGIDADANGVLYVYDGGMSRVMRVEPALLGWTATPIPPGQPFQVIFGLALTRDDAGNAEDIFISTVTSGLWNVDVATGADSQIGSTPVAEGGRTQDVEASGSCEELLCVIPFTEIVPDIPDGGCGCVGTSLNTFAVFALFAGSAVVYDGFETGRCTHGLARVSSTEYYVGSTTNRCQGTNGRIDRIVDRGAGFTRELVANLPPLPGGFGVHPTGISVVTVPEPMPGLTAAAVAASLVLLGRRRRSAWERPARRDRRRRSSRSRARV